MYSKLIIFATLFTAIYAMNISDILKFKLNNIDDLGDLETLDTNTKRLLNMKRNYFKSDSYETNIEDATTKPIFQRKISQLVSPKTVEVDSENENVEHSRRRFKFNLKTTPHGVMLKYKTELDDLNEHEVTHVMFQKMFTYQPISLFSTVYSNETMENIVTLSEDIFNPIICTATVDYKSCNLTSKDGKFSMIVDYSATPFQKQSLVIIKHIFSTDIKVTLIFNVDVPHTRRFGIITTFKTATNSEVESKPDKVYSTDDTVTTGNYTYFSFETVALTELEEIINVTMTKTSLPHLLTSNILYENYSNEDIYAEHGEDNVTGGLGGEYNSDNEEDDDDDDTNEFETFTIFTFSSNGNLTKIIWDPTLGASSAFTGVDLTQQTTTTSSSSSNFPAYGIALIVIGCSLLLFSVVGVALYKHTKNNKNKNKNYGEMNSQQSELQMNMIS